MKKVILTFILILPALLSAADKNITLQDIPGTTWEWHGRDVNRWPQFAFKFKSDGNLEVIPESVSYGFGESGGIFTGTYKVVNDELILNYKDYSAYDSMNNPGYKPEVYEKRGKIGKLAGAVQFDTYINFGDVIIVCKDSVVKEGLPVTKDGVEVVTTGGKTGLVTKNAKIRSMPDVKSEFIYIGVDLGYEGLAYCPAGKELKILARTKNKLQVEKWNNYWYYAELTSAGEFGARYGWIYGEFVKVK